MEAPAVTASASTATAAAAAVTTAAAAATTAAHHEAEDGSEEDSVSLAHLGDRLDLSTFDQILEMDDDEEYFSRSIVFGYFDQAEDTFTSMEKALGDRDLRLLSSLGHFLKGSSATLGLTKVSESCAKIQHLGAGKDETGTTELDDELCLERIRGTLEVAKEEYKAVEEGLKRFYGSS